MPTSPDARPRRPPFLRSALLSISAAAVLLSFVGSSALGGLHHTAETIAHKAETSALDDASVGLGLRNFDQLLEAAHRRGRIPVILRMREPEGALSAGFLPPGKDGRAATLLRLRERLDAARPVLAERRRRIIARLGRRADAGVTYQHLPVIAMQVNAAELEALRQDPDVVAISEDLRLYPSLGQSLSLIGGPAPIAGYGGAGQAVVVIDTGVDRNHSWFSGKLVGEAEACFSGINDDVAVSLCPPPAPPDFGACEGVLGNPDHMVCGPGAGGNCPTSQASVCWHGTHVAGIAVGDPPSGGISGVAPDADLISIQVFSLSSDGGSVAAKDDPTRNDSATDAPGTATGLALVATTADTLAALDHVLDLKVNGGLPIASVNMSLGTAQTWSSTLACDAEGINNGMWDAVQRLREAGVAVVIAAGNSSSGVGLSFPGCLSNAISVGATYDTSDAIASFSNRSTALTLFAPGVSITSATVGGGTRSASGTSMATPHVAGTFAVLAERADELKQQGAPPLSVDNLLAALAETGPKVDAGYGVPRIQVDSALAALDQTAPKHLILDSHLFGIGEPRSAMSAVGTEEGAFDSISSTNAYGGDAMRGIAAGGNMQRFAPVLAPGYYGVDLWWPALAGNDTAATVSIGHDGGIDNILIDQTIAGTRWNPVGTYLMGHHEASFVEFTDSGAPPGVVSDAVRFRFLGEGPVPLWLAPAEVAPVTVGSFVHIPFEITGGVPPYEAALSGVLAPGLSFDVDLMAITGIPQTVQSPTPLTLAVTDAEGAMVTGLYQHEVLDPTGQFQTLFFESEPPTGATIVETGAWSWVPWDGLLEVAIAEPIPGVPVLQSGVGSGMHRYVMHNLAPAQGIAVGNGDRLFVDVWLDPANPPRELLIVWQDDDGVEPYEHRAYWGENLFSYGSDGTAGRRFMGPLPPLGSWVRLEVPADSVALADSTIIGIGLYLYDGRAAFSRNGVLGPSATGDEIPRLSFALACCRVSEADGSIAVEVQRTGSPAGAVSIDYATADGTALAGEDYVASAGTLSFADRDMAPKSIGVTILDDGVYEGTEHFSLALAGAVGGVAQAPSRIAITVDDDDPPPTRLISGRVTVSASGLPAVTLVADPGAVCTLTDADGYYDCEVLWGWTGSIWPSAQGYRFDAVSRSYTDVQADILDQHFTAVAMDDTVWLEDADPPDATLYSEYGWRWSEGGSAAPFSGAKALYSRVYAGLHRHVPVNVDPADGLSLEVDDVLYTYVWLDPAHPPRSILLAFQDSDGVNQYEHRAYWGENLWTWGVDGTASRLPMGALPAAGGWVRLGVPAADLDLAGATVRGIGFYAYDGRLAFDQLGKSSGLATEAEIAWSATNYGVAENAGSVMLTVERSGISTGAVSVGYSTADGSAVSGADYLTASGALVFADGDMAPKTVQVDVLDDTSYEGEEAFTVTLISISGGKLSTPATAVVTIADDDPLPAYSVSGQVTLDGLGLADVVMRGSNAAACADTDAGGYYSCEVLQGWSGSITPAAAGYGFAPASRSYSEVQSDQTGQDYTATELLDTVWIEDTDPPGATVVSEYGWTWSDSGPAAPYSGSKALYSPVNSGMHRHVPLNLAPANGLVLEAGDVLYTYVWLDPANPPRSLLLVFQDSDGVNQYDHRAYWGENLWAWGVDGAASRLPMGSLPAASGWARLEVPAADLDLAGATVRGVGFYAYDGRVAFDQIGKASALAASTPSYAIRGQVTVDGSGLAAVSIAADGAAQCTGTDAVGAYSCTVPQGWSGSIWPSAAGYSFTPALRSYSDVQSDQTGREYTATELLDTVWLEDADPVAATLYSEYGWNWSSTGPVAPHSGSKALYSQVRTGMHRHAPINADPANGLMLETGDMLYTYIWLDPANPPRSILLVFQDNDGVDKYEHRAYWGENLWTWGVEGTASRLPMGSLPAAGGWVRLDVSAADVDLAGAAARGMGFYVYDGRVAFDQVGKSSAPK